MTLDEWMNIVQPLFDRAAWTYVFFFAYLRDVRCALNPLWRVSPARVFILPFSYPMVWETLCPYGSRGYLGYLGSQRAEPKKVSQKLSLETLFVS